MARSILKIQKAKFLGKSQLFKPPFGWFFRLLGGHPVDRSSSHDLVHQVVSIFNSHEEFISCACTGRHEKKSGPAKNRILLHREASKCPDRAVWI